MDVTLGIPLYRPLLLVQRRFPDANTKRMRLINRLLTILERKRIRITQLILVLLMLLLLLHTTTIIIIIRVLGLLILHRRLHLLHPQPHRLLLLPQRLLRARPPLALHLHDSITPTHGCPPPALLLPLLALHRPEQRLRSPRRPPPQCTLSPPQTPMSRPLAPAPTLCVRPRELQVFIHFIDIVIHAELLPTMRRRGGSLAFDRAGPLGRAGRCLRLVGGRAGEGGGGRVDGAVVEGAGTRASGWVVGGGAVGEAAGLRHPRRGDGAAAGFGGGG